MLALAKNAVASCFALKLSMAVVLSFFSNHFHIIAVSAFAGLAPLHKAEETMKKVAKLSDDTICKLMREN